MPDIGRDGIAWCALYVVLIAFLAWPSVIHEFPSVADMKAEGWAAWVQAIGSIAAIWGALAAARRGADRAALATIAFARSQRDQEISASVKYAAGVLFGAARLFDMLVKTFERDAQAADFKSNAELARIIARYVARLERISIGDFTEEELGRIAHVVDTLEGISAWLAATLKHTPAEVQQTLPEIIESMRIFRGLSAKYGLEMTEAHAASRKDDAST